MFKQSVQILELALKVFMQVCACEKEKVQVAAMLNNLGGTYLRWGQYQKSRYAVKTIAI